MGLTRVAPVARGQIATIVTSLEMRQRPVAIVPAKSALKLVEWLRPIPADAYRDLYRQIGQPWLWAGRLAIDAASLPVILNAPTTQVLAATRRDGTRVGLLELDFAVPGACEIVHFGLVPDVIGRDHGLWLLAHALRLAWVPGITRVWLHTSSRDHPGALDFHRRNGFVPFERRVEIHDDPRLTGIHPVTVASWLPII